MRPTTRTEWNRECVFQKFTLFEKFLPSRSNAVMCFKRDFYREEIFCVDFTAKLNQLTPIFMKTAMIKVVRGGPPPQLISGGGRSQLVAVGLVVRLVVVLRGRGRRGRRLRGQRLDGGRRRVGGRGRRLAVEAKAVGHGLVLLGGGAAPEAIHGRRRHIELTHLGWHVLGGGWRRGLLLLLLVAVLRVVPAAAAAAVAAAATTMAGTTTVAAAIEVAVVPRRAAHLRVTVVIVAV